MTYRFRSAVLPLGILTLVAAGPARADQITVFAASSLKTALDRIAATWEQQTGHDVALSYASSPQLARQIRHGAPADIFISAAPDWMDVLGDAELIDAHSRVDLLGNDLVLIAADPGAAPVTRGPGDKLAELDLAALLDGGKLAMAMVDAVPAGVYGKQALTSLGLWDSIADHVAQADSARAALALVASAEAPLGVVYASDARAEPKVTAIGRFPAGSHDPIIYPAALVAASAERQAARDFLAALQDDPARQVFAEEGFAPLPRR